MSFTTLLLRPWHDMDKVSLAAINGSMYVKMLVLETYVGVYIGRELMRDLKRLST